MATIAINSFVRRQTAHSKFSHYDGNFEEVLSLVGRHFASAQPSGRDGVVAVPLPPEGFFSGVVEVSADTQLRAVFAARRRGETPYLQVEAVGAVKLPARYVEAILYRHDILLATGDAETEAGWELISLNARPTEEPEPPTPVAMARNMLGLPGGSPASYTAEEFAAAIIYWSTRAMCGE